MNPNLTIAPLKVQTGLGNTNFNETTMQGHVCSNYIYNYISLTDLAVLLKNHDYYISPSACSIK